MWHKVSSKTEEFSFRVSDCGQSHIQAVIVGLQTAIYNTPYSFFSFFMQNMYILIEIVCFKSIKNSEQGASFFFNIEIWILPVAKSQDNSLHK